jgi:hypothetical protein
VAAAAALRLQKLSPPGEALPAEANASGLYYGMRRDGDQGAEHQTKESG